MTLFKQIALLVSTVFLLLLVIIVLNDVQRTSHFLQGQMQTTAQDMATTLGVAISNVPAGDDTANLEVLFNAVFDSGYYSRIELVGMDGQLIHQKSQQLGVEGVPGWFLKWVPLSAAQGSARVMKGWSQLGQLNLSLHPGFAYSSLYNTLVSALTWFAFIFIASMLVLWVVLQFILKPLQRVKEQADAIHRNKFVQQKKIPVTIELKSVVEAMNHMVSKVQSIFDDQEKTLSRYQQLLYRDKLTNLGNRRYLLDQLHESMSDESDNYASMAIIKIENFEQFRLNHGYEVSDNLVKIVTGLLLQQHAGYEAQRVSRFNEDEFAFLFAGDESAVNDFICSVFERFKALSKDDSDLKNMQLLAGICALETGADISSVLSSIDYCLAQARASGPFSIEQKYSLSLNLPMGKIKWRSWFESAFESRNFFLVGQLVIDNEQNAVQRELFIRARDQQNQIVPASAFMPIASSLGVSLDIDKEVFSLIAGNKNLNREVPLALNLSAAFFRLAEAQDEFDLLLTDFEKTGTPLCIEARHHELVQYPQMCAQISDRVRRHGHQFGIDNLDLGQSLQLLQLAYFDYAKINAKILQEMSRDDLLVGYQALRTITDTLDMCIIAVGVDSQQVFNELRSLGIEVMQGNFLSSPEVV